MDSSIFPTISINNSKPRHFYILGEDGAELINKSQILVAGDPPTCLTEITGKLLLIGFCDITICAENPSNIEFPSAPSVKFLDGKHLEENNFQNLKRYNCVIYFGHNLAKAEEINRSCRLQSPSIKFINAATLGGICWCFCDFSDDDVVSDGEDAQQAFVSNIIKGCPTVVTLHEDAKFQTGDRVVFSNVDGMANLNGSSHEIQVFDNVTLFIGDMSSEDFEEYQGGGICRKINNPIHIKHKPLKDQIANPNFTSIDGKDEKATIAAFRGIIALDRFRRKFGHFPLQNDEKDFAVLKEIVKDDDDKYKAEICEKTLRKISNAAVCGDLPLLQNCIAAVAVQEAVKAVTLKFTPLNQWLVLDILDLIPDKNLSGDVLGKELMDKLRTARILMVGCGAVGCEILRSLSALGVATDGMITVVDHGIVKDANLNTQSLICSCDRLKPKSVVAAKAIKRQYKDILVSPHNLQVGQQLCGTVFDDKFFEKQNLIISAVDNDKAARWLDRKCVQNCKPFVDCRVNGLKGYVQPIIPHYTQSLPLDNPINTREEQIPYCTLKSFPVKQIHAIQWAREKFENLFWRKPLKYKLFWDFHGNVGSVLKMLDKEEFVEGGEFVSKFLQQKLNSWEDCVKFARVKFEKYFNHKANQLLHNFPLDTRLENGHSFWTRPKRPPSPITFNPNNILHMTFVTSAAILFAHIWNVQIPTKGNGLEETLAGMTLPQFTPNSSKVIETDESIKKPRMDTEDTIQGDKDVLLSQLMNFPTATEKSSVYPAVHPIAYDKDDTPLHTCFVDTTSKLRATMYGIEPPVTDFVIQTAGKITPSLVTTAAITAFIAVSEVLRIIKPSDKTQHKNCLFNLARAEISFVDPQFAPVTLIKDGMSFTLWDTWTVYGDEEFTLQQFVDHIKSEKGVEITTVVQGSKIVYMPFMPGHGKRLAQPILKLIDRPAVSRYVELTVIIETGDGEVGGPAIKYYFGGSGSS